MLEQLEGDHRDWLLIAAYNLLMQRKADRALTLLELLNLIDPDCRQCRTMLAYANLLLDDRQGCADAVSPLELERAELPPRGKAAIDALTRLAGAGQGSG